MKADRDAPDADALAIANRLRPAGKALAVAQPHEVERFLRRQHRAVAGAGVIAVGMSDKGALDRMRRIDVEVAERAADAAARLPS